MCSMEATNESVILDEQEFDEQIFDGDYNLDDNAMECFDEIIIEQPQTVGVSEGGCLKKGAKKRRANLTEFGESVTIKRKNESAKRELTSIVNQVSSFLRVATSISLSL